MKAGIAIVVVILGVLGAAFAGVINLPGVTPAKKKPAAAKPAAVTTPPKEKKKKRTSNPPPAVNVSKRAIGPDVAKGELTVAQIWDSLTADKLSEIVKDWKEPELAKILLKMDSEKVSALLSQLDGAKASKLTKAIQKEAERILPPPPTP